MNKKQLDKFRTGLYAANPENAKALADQVIKLEEKLKEVQLLINWDQLRINNWAELCSVISPKRTKQ